MMKQRLDLAKDLLKDDGVIFVSIDDKEQAYLKVLMDEIFGEENFCNTLIWEKNYAPKSNNKKFSVNHDYVLVYFKNYLIYESKYKKINPEPKKESQLSHYKYDDNDGRGLWRSGDLTIYGDKNNYPIINPDTGIKYYPKKNKNWRFNSCKMQKMIAENRIQFPKNGAPNLKRYLKQVREGITPLSIINYQKGGHTHKASQELESIFSVKDLFSFPKPQILIKYLINRINNKNAIILDFFAGSGTTGHAVMELNREDGGNRQFILCTNNENQIAENITYERLHRVIKGEGTNGEKDFKWLEKNQPYIEEKLRVIWIDDTVKINNDIPNGEKIENEILQGLKLLNPLYSEDNLNFYYDLAALNPLENE